MERGEVLARLIELAREAGLIVREIPESTSGACRVRDEVWLVLGGGDPVEERIAVVAAALREHAPDLVESRYLPPVLRECLTRPPGSP